MPQLKFQIYTFLGSWPWCFALAYIGAKLGERWETDPTLREIFHRFDVLIVAVYALAVIWYVWRHWRHRLSSEE
jgi:membrane protein DedA with SNARE-associated domain